jgi:hypothetical protein
MTLDPKWIELFHRDVAADAGFERRLLLKQWLITLILFFLILMRRLFV